MEVYLLKVKNLKIFLRCFDQKCHKWYVCYFNRDTILLVHKMVGFKACSSSLPSQPVVFLVQHYVPDMGNNISARKSVRVVIPKKSWTRKHLKMDSDTSTDSDDVQELTAEYIRQHFPYIIEKYKNEDTVPHQTVLNKFPELKFHFAQKLATNLAQKVRLFFQARKAMTVFFLLLGKS